MKHQHRTLSIASHLERSRKAEGGRRTIGPRELVKRRKRWLPNGVLASSERLKITWVTLVMLDWVHSS
jgi:hypothetical protein